MKSDVEEFKSITIKDKGLLEIIDRIHKERDGITKLILDMAEARGEIENNKHKWFEKVIKKYNIPKEYTKILIYDHEKHKITLS